MTSSRKGVLLLKILLLTTVLSSIVVTTSLLIKDVFAYDETGQLSQPANTVDYSHVYSGEIPYIVSYNSTFSPHRVTAIVITEHVTGITYGTTVRDALYDLGIPILDSYAVTPPLGTPVTDDMLIRIDAITKERRIETEIIPYQSVSFLDDTREIDTTTVVQTGFEGEKKVVYEYAYINGMFSTKTAVREEITASAQNELVAVGTMRVFRPMTVGVDTFSYWKVMRVFATSYDAFCEGCNQWTATGAIVDKGICAVDRNVIPMHSRFYVPGYGFCVAEDVGGAIRGNRIDLGFDDLRHHQGEWSARYVDIYLLD